MLGGQASQQIYTHPCGVFERCTIDDSIKGWRELLDSWRKGPSAYLTSNMTVIYAARISADADYSH